MRVERLVLRLPPPIGAAMVPVRRLSSVLALSYQLLGRAATAWLGALKPHSAGAVRMRMRLGGQRPAAIAPALRGFLSASLDAANLHTIEAPALILTQPADAVHPLQTGELLFDRLPNATFCVAPTATFWDGDLEGTADLIAASLVGRHADPGNLVACRRKTSGERRAHRSVGGASDDM